MRKTISFAAAIASLGLASAASAADLTGVWTNTSITQLARPRGMTDLVVTEAQAQTIASGNSLVQRAQADTRPSDLSKDITADGNTELGYNAGWMDWGRTLGRVKGEYRTSWIVEPADGQLPLTEAAKSQQRIAGARQRTAPPGPESLAPNDRCLIGSRGSGGPGMLNNLYNNTYQIVQTKDAVAIVVEMVHDARVIPVFTGKAAAQAAHRPAVMHPWLGDSVAWWEGETLVIETTNVHPEQGGYGPIFLSAEGKVIERLSRASPTELFYAFEVSDPHYYTTPWRAEMSLNASDGQVYEYACHEGNYAMEGILAGARSEERLSAAAPSGTGR